MNRLVVENVRITAAGAADQATGLIGFVTATVAGLVIDGITIRRGLDHELRLGFPTHKDKFGIKHAVVRPADDSVRREITQAILGALGLAATATDDRRVQADSRQ